VQKLENNPTDYLAIGWRSNHCMPNARLMVTFSTVNLYNDQVLSLDSDRYFIQDPTDLSINEIPRGLVWTRRWIGRISEFDFESIPRPQYNYTRFPDWLTAESVYRIRTVLFLLFRDIQAGRLQLPGMVTTNQKPQRAQRYWY
jgi:hypothetical protein